MKQSSKLANDNYSFGEFIKNKAGIGLRHPHYQEIAFSPKRDDIAWLEVHSENFFAFGGMSKEILDRVSEHYPLSFHGVGLSLGSAEDLDQEHLNKLKRLHDRYKPCLISEHISWSKIDGQVLNDLLPLPYTKEAMEHVVNHIDHLQNFLGRQILVENPSTYLQVAYNEMPEYEFMSQVIKRSGCKLLFDINNIFVTQKNHGLNAIDYIKAMPKEAIGEYHLAGHAVVPMDDNTTLLIDHHGDVVCDEVWQLYRHAIDILGSAPTLIEWDTNIPSLDVILGEAKKAQTILDQL